MSELVSWTFAAVLGLVLLGAALRFSPKGLFLDRQLTLFLIFWGAGLSVFLLALVNITQALRPLIFN